MGGPRRRAPPRGVTRGASLLPERLGRGGAPAAGEQVRHGGQEEGAAGAGGQGQGRRRGPGAGRAAAGSAPGIRPFSNLLPAPPQLAREHGIRFFETSAKSSVNVDEVRSPDPRPRPRPREGEGAWLPRRADRPAPRQAFSSLARDILLKSGGRRAVSRPRWAEGGGWGEPREALHEGGYSPHTQTVNSLKPQPAVCAPTPCPPFCL